MIYIGGLEVNFLVKKGVNNGLDFILNPVILRIKNWGGL